MQQSCRAEAMNGSAVTDIAGEGRDIAPRDDRLAYFAQVMTILGRQRTQKALR